MVQNTIPRRARYREILVGFEEFSFDEQALAAHETEFEMALRDLLICKQCRATKIECTQIERGDKTTVYNEIEDKDGDEDEESKPPKLLYRIKDCKSSQGGGWWWGLSRKGCQMYKRPTFSLHNCAGPVVRAEEMRRALLSDREEPTGLRRDA